MIIKIINYILLDIFRLLATNYLKDITAVWGLYFLGKIKHKY